MLEQSTVKKYLKTGIEKFSQEANIPITHSRILIEVDDNENVIYTFTNRFEPERVVDFNKDILNLDWDLLAREAIVAMFIKEAVKRFSDKYKCNAQELKTYVMAIDAEMTEIFLLPYVNNKQVGAAEGDPQHITIAELLGEE